MNAQNIPDLRYFEVSKKFEKRIVLRRSVLFQNRKVIPEVFVAHLNLTFMGCLARKCIQCWNLISRIGIGVIKEIG